MVKFSRFSRGLNPNYVWKDGVVGSKAHYVGHHDSSDTWMSLFLDLIYVCVFAKLTHLFVGCEPTTELFIFTFATFIMFYYSRFNIDEYALRFYQDDVFNRITFISYIGFVIVMTLNIDMDKVYPSSKSYTSSEDNSHRSLAGGGEGGGGDAAAYPICIVNDTYYLGYAMGFLGTRTIVSFLYVVNMIFFDKDGKVRQQFMARVVPMMMSVFFLLLGTWAAKSSTHKIGVLLLVALFEYTVQGLGILNFKLVQWGYISKERVWSTFHFPMNLFKIQERASVFFLLVVGEGAFALLYPVWDAAYTNEIAVSTLFGYILLFSFTMQYYDRATRHEGSGEMHAGRRSAIAGFVFLSSHTFLSYFTLIAVQGIVEVCSNVRDSHNAGYERPLRAGAREFLVYGCVGTSFLIHFMRILHDGLYAQFNTGINAARYIINFAISCMHFALLSTDMVPLNQLIVHALIALSVVAVEMAADLILGHFDQRQAKYKPQGAGAASPTDHHDNEEDIRLDKVLDILSTESAAAPHTAIQMVEPTVAGDEDEEGEEDRDGEEEEEEDGNIDESNVPDEFLVDRRMSLLARTFNDEDAERLKSLIALAPKEILIECLQQRIV